MQASLTFLLDHLKRVTLRSEVNRMTSADIATCLGPIIFCPAPQTDADRSNMTSRLGTYVELLQYLIDIWTKKRGEVLSILRIVRFVKLYRFY